MWILIMVYLVQGELMYHHLQAFETEHKCLGTLAEIQDNFEPRERLVCVPDWSNND